ncbi:hypothetical protein TRFO_33656 [Tritrichomonas foetus]|uniref:Ubiquitin-like domain-containing protein n=1 Tax=Tritrichomonas foetus TaxID=1144522 RepID=A0A1J4JQK3_9EUKA|nr:hypothetical protein TRFO_33656 [Tritrichomonas foetus]|eukprot:OHS99795.1 hypothetical protein TRFO_33656 [Tritrichomonas foetus]
MSNHIKKVVIIVPNTIIKDVYISSIKPIKYLYGMFPRDYWNQFAFIVNGSVLNDENTFNYYNIEDMTNIICVRQNDEKAVTKWIRMTKDVDEFNKRVHHFKCPALKREASKLRDIRLMKEEIIKRNHRNIHFFREIQNFIGLDHHKTSLNLDYPELEAPAEDLLPVLW